MDYIDLTRSHQQIPPRPAESVPAGAVREATPAVPSSSVPRWVKALIAVMAIGLASLGGMLAWERSRSDPSPDTSGALATAFRTYHASQGPALRSLAAQIRSGSIGGSDRESDREAIGKTIKQHSATLAAALNGYFDAHCNEEGNLISRSVVADDFDAAARAVGGK